MAANAIDLTLAATVAGDLGVASDATVQRVVTAASRMISRWCVRDFTYATGIVEYPNGDNRPYLIVRKPPIVSITSIVESGVTLDPSEYESVDDNAEAGLIYRLDGPFLYVGQQMGGVTAVFDPKQGDSTSQGITLTYAGGYVTPGQNAVNSGLYPTVTLPEDVQEAAIMTAGYLYKYRGVDTRVKAMQLGDYSVQYRDPDPENVIPAPAREILGYYRRLTVP